MALTTFLSTALVQALKEGKLERVQKKRETVKIDFFELKNTFSEKPKQVEKEVKEMPQLRIKI